MNSEWDAQENAEEHHMVERGAALSWYDEVYGEYRAAVVLNVALEMAETAPVFPCVPNMVFYDDDYDSVTGKYNVRLRHCPKPFTQVCENAYGHSCFADASEDARMMRPVTYLESFATRSEWEPVLDEDIEEVLTLRRKEQKEQQKTYAPQEPDGAASRSPAGSFLQNMRARINAKTEQSVQVSSQERDDEDQERDGKHLMDMIAAQEDVPSAKPETYVRSEGMQALFRSVADQKPDGKDHSSPSGPGLG